MDRRLVLILVLLLAGGITLSVAARFFGVFSFDLEVAQWLRGSGHPILMTVMRAVSFPGEGWVPAVLVTAGAAVCAAKRKWTEAFFIVATMSSVLIAGTMKFLIGRPRPSAFGMNLSDLARPGNQYAYPSGHTLFYVVFFGFVAYLAWTRLTGPADPDHCLYSLHRAHRPLPCHSRGALGE